MSPAPDKRAAAAGAPNALDEQWVAWIAGIVNSIDPNGHQIEGDMRMLLEMAFYAGSSAVVGLNPSACTAEIKTALMEHLARMDRIVEKPTT